MRKEVFVVARVGELVVVRCVVAWQQMGGRRDEGACNSEVNAMSSSPAPSLARLMVIDRDLAVLDDSADVEEMVERVLYYYPLDEPVATRLQYASTYEGLADFVRCVCRPAAA